MPHLRKLSSNFFPYFSIAVLTFCNIAAFKAGCIYQLRVVQVQDDLEEARRPRKRCGATVAVCVEEGGCVCVSLLSSWNPPKCELRPRLEISTSWCQVEPLLGCPLLFSTSFTVYTFYPALQLASIRLSLVRTWLRIPGSLEGPLPPEPEPAGPVPT